MFLTVGLLFQRFVITGSVIEEATTAAAAAAAATGATTTAGMY